MDCNERHLIVGILEKARAEPGRAGHELAAIDHWIDKVEEEFPYPAMKMMANAAHLTATRKGR